MRKGGGKATKGVSAVIKTVEVNWTHYRGKVLAGNGHASLREARGRKSRENAARTIVYDNSDNSDRVVLPTLRYYAACNQALTA